MKQFGFKLTPILCAAFCIMMLSPADAQIGKRISERIKESTTRKVEDKVVNKAGEKTDQALDSVFKKRTISSDKSSDDNQEEKATSPGFNFGNMSNATYESSYTLHQEFKVEIKTQEKKKKNKVETINMDMHYGEDCYMTVVQDPDQKSPPKSIMDLKNNTSIMLNDVDMSAMAISMDFMTKKMKEMVDKDQDSIADQSDYTFTRTGNTKTIAGYLCEEYIIESSEIKMNVWYTDDITIEMHQSMGDYAMFSSFSAPITAASNGQLVGTMMESHMVEKTGDEGTFDYLVKEVKIATSTIKMSDYTFTKMGMN